jgi:hypothetical protein
MAALVAGEFLVFTGEGDVYSEEEVRGWLQESGRQREDTGGHTWGGIGIQQIKIK